MPPRQISPTEILKTCQKAFLFSSVRENVWQQKPFQQQSDIERLGSRPE